jgi:hypothetical protein
MSELEDSPSPETTGLADETDSGEAAPGPAIPGFREGEGREGGREGRALAVERPAMEVGAAVEVASGELEGESATYHPTMARTSLRVRVTRVPEWSELPLLFINVLNGIILHFGNQNLPLFHNFFAIQTNHRFLANSQCF